MRNIHILLVEDNDGDILLTTEFLESEFPSNKLTIVRDGEAAIDFLKKEIANTNSKIPDIILLDINLPKKNGHEVLQFIRADNDLKDMPVIMLTTSSSSRDITLSNSQNANGFITKPLAEHNSDILINSLQALKKGKN